MLRASGSTVVEEGLAAGVALATRPMHHFQAPKEGDDMRDKTSNPTAVIQAAQIGAAGVVAAALVHGAFWVAIQRDELRSAEVSLELARLQAQSIATSAVGLTRTLAGPQARGEVNPVSRNSTSTKSTSAPMVRKGPGYNPHHGGGA